MLIYPSPLDPDTYTRKPRAAVQVIGVKLTGKLSKWSSPKDVILKVTHHSLHTAPHPTCSHLHLHTHIYKHNTVGNCNSTLLTNGTLIHPYYTC